MFTNIKLIRHFRGQRNGIKHIHAIITNSIFTSFSSPSTKTLHPLSTTTPPPLP